MFHTSFTIITCVLLVLITGTCVFLPVTEREVPDGALPHGQGVRSVEAGPRVSDRGQCEGHLRPSRAVLPGTSTEGTCCYCVLRLSIWVKLCQINPFNCIILRKFLLV